MALIEALTLTLAPVIAKSILKLWLKDQAVALDVSSSLVDLLGQKLKDVTTKQHAKREFEEIGEKVALSLLPFFKDAKLDESSQEAVVFAVSKTIENAKINADILAKKNLDPHILYKYLSEFKTADTGFSKDEDQFFDRILAQAASYIVDIAYLLPNFTDRTLGEVLKREDELIKTVDYVLKEVEQIRIDSQRANQDENVAYFEESYRRSILRLLDRPDIFGLSNLSRASQKHRLSVAYISLSVIKRDTKGEKNDPNKPNEGFREQPREIVESALAQSDRLTILGAAGSGKTTLLKWLAINSVIGGFKGLLNSWNDTIPFFIPLRRYVNKSLPLPEDFVQIIAPEIFGVMPKNWVHNCLSSGRALVLVDGLDELPQAQRNNVRQWLEGLVALHTNSKFIVSSRPYAIEQGWLNEYEFLEAELQPMELSDIYTFVDHWHSAIKEELNDEEEKNEVVRLASNFRDVVTNNKSIFNLATSPLLCAALCALHRDRRQQIPNNRIEVYDALCQMLLERRETERQLIVNKIDYPELSYSQKRIILEGLAYWMILNGWSNITLDDAERYIARKIRTMIGLPNFADAASIRRLLTERSGIIREPSVGIVDFVHKSLQEFLAAKALLDNEDLGIVKNNAGDDQWQQVIVLSAGLASSKVREQIIREIVQRGNKDWTNRHKFYMLAVGCLEGAVELSQKLQEDVNKHLEEIIPPKNIHEARAIASAKDLAAPFLILNKSHSENESIASIQALELIGTDAAFSALKSYVDDKRPSVMSTLVMAGRSYDEDVFIQNISSKLDPNELSLSGLVSLKLVEPFKKIKELSLSNCAYLDSLDALTNLVKINSLELNNLPNITEILPIAAISNIKRLLLKSLPRVDKFYFISFFRKLQELTLCDLRELRHLWQVWETDSNFENAITVSSPAASSLETLRLQSLPVNDISTLSIFENLRDLEIVDLPITSIKPLLRCKSLQRLHFDKVNILDLEELEKLPPLKTLSFGKSFKEENIPDHLPRNRISIIAEHIKKYASSKNNKIYKDKYRNR